MTSKNNIQRGFSLIEIAVVLVIVAVLISIVAVPLATQVDQQRTNETNKQLEQIKEAIYGFAMANGRLPCPSRLVDNGVESVPALNDGNCPTFNGFVPAVTLGLAPLDANGFMVDGWGGDQNRIRYAVSNISVTGAATPTCPANVTFPLTKPSPAGIKVATIDCLISKPLLSICSKAPNGAAGAATGCVAGSALTTNAPFVVFSHGKNMAFGTGGTDEAHNLDADGYFVSRTPTGTSAPGGEFDDLVTWGSLPILYSKLVSVGKLP